MKKITFGEFQRLCEREVGSQYVFISENQKGMDVSDSIGFRLSFPSIYVTCCPNVICLKNGENYLRICKINNIQLSEDKTELGTTFNILCRDNKRYTIIAQ